MQCLVWPTNRLWFVTRNRLDSSSNNFLMKFDGSLLRLDRKFATQIFTTLQVLLNCLLAVPRKRIQAHQLAVCFFVSRIDGHELLESFHGLTIFTRVFVKLRKLSQHRLMQST